MYDSHMAFVEPAENDLLWRYMDFTKFVALMEQRALYFQRITNLEDPYEGTLTKATAERMRRTPSGLSKEEADHRRRVVEHNISFMTHMRAIFSVSCWHIASRESDSMWGRYLNGADGIAVQTTFGSFKKAFKGSSVRVYGCQVEYIDYETTEIDEAQSFNWVKYKRKEFEQDREFRGVVMSAGLTTVGEFVPLDLEQLIETIYVSPASQSWVFDLVCTLVNRHGLEANVETSRIARGPDYLSGSS